MHPTAAYEITKARIADQQRQRKRHAIAHAALFADQLRMSLGEGRGLT